MFHARSEFAGGGRIGRPHGDRRRASLGGGFVDRIGGLRELRHHRRSSRSRAPSGIVAELQIASVRAHVSLSLYTDFENFSVFKPAASHIAQMNLMLDQVVAWSGALKTVRDERVAKAAA
jgi:hypothetical protein